jgi:hypothetical protein
LRVIAGADDRRHGDGRRRSRKDKTGPIERRGDGKADDRAESGQGGERRGAAQVESRPLLCGCNLCVRIGPQVRLAVRRIGGRLCFRPGGKAGRLAGRAGARQLVRYLGVEQIAATRDQFDQLALIIAKRCANLADALEQAVVADMDVRPDRRDQVMLAEHTPGINRE